jgi:REP-associated tyrosine transposase
MHQNLFQRQESANLLLETIFRYRDAGEFLLHEFVLMPNHIHLLLSVDDDHAIGRAMQMVKGGFSHALHGTGLKSTVVWQPSYYEHRVRDMNEYRRMRAYIHDNPVRRGLVQMASEYSHSSAATAFRLDEVPERLKPENKGGGFDAGLKARTTRTPGTQTPGRP